MLISEIYRKFCFWHHVDRIGPDVPLTHWRLHFNSLMRRFCNSKFMRFGVGAEFRAGAYAVCCSKISLGNRVIIRPGCMLFADPRSNGAGIKIEDDVMLGSGVHIYVHNHKFDNPSLPIIDQGYYKSEEVLIERGAWIGAGAIILPGVTIGRNSVIGAGAVVTKSVPAFSVACGNPAKTIKKIG